MQELMDWGVFQEFLGELSGLSYAGWLAFHNYNEPLLNPRLSDELAEVRRLVPTARAAIYTNGDVLDLDRTHELFQLGVRYLRVTRYPHTVDVRPDFADIEAWLSRAKLLDGFDWTFRELRQGLGATYRDAERDILVEVIRPKIAHYNDRGGTAKVPHVNSPRVAPCLMTATSASIDFRGDLKMCCNVVPGVADHDQYIVGNLSGSSFAQLWLSATMERYRERHAVADWSESPACRYCSQALPETRQRRNDRG
jgi:hypothetical protein